MEAVTLTNPSALAALSDGKVDHVSFGTRLFGPTFFGSVGVNGTVNMTITYEYHVPESGSTFAWFGVTLAGLCITRRRLGRGRARFLAGTKFTHI